MLDLTRYAWLSIATGVTVFGLKIGAYAITGSVGLLSDALESIVNIVAAVVALVALRTAMKPADERHHFGHGKAEYFSAQIEGFMILLAAVVIIGRRRRCVVDEFATRQFAREPLPSVGGVPRECRDA